MGEPFLFKLHAPRNYIVGGGFFTKFLRFKMLNGVFWSTPSLGRFVSCCCERAGDGDRTRDVQLGKLVVD
jgi:hypothetical protein